MRSAATRSALAAFALVTGLACSPGSAQVRIPQAQPQGPMFDLQPLQLPSLPQAPQQPMTPEEREARAMARTFALILQRILEESVVNPNAAQIATEAIRRMVSEIDPHSSYMTAEELDEMRRSSSGTFAGIGAEIEAVPNGIRIGRVIENSPAERARLKDEDVITSIDGRPAAGMTTQQAVELIRGRPGTSVNLSVERQGEAAPLNFTVVRNVVRTNPTVSANLGEGVGYVHLRSFSERSASSIQDAVTRLQREMATAGTPFRGLVLDLRGNPGGLLNEGVAVSDLFLDHTDVITTSRGRDPSNEQVFRARRGDILNGQPLIVLTNGGSASASEIVAGALQDYRRATILGTGPSFGKGSVQTVMPLAPYGGVGALRLTTALYFTPSGVSIQGNGVVPNVRFEDPNAPPPVASGEATLSGMIPNPAPAGNTARATTASVCSPAQGAQAPAAGTMSSRFTLRSGNLDYQLLCAFETLRGSPRLTVTVPAPAPQAPVPGSAGGPP